MPKHKVTISRQVTEVAVFDFGGEAFSSVEALKEVQDCIYEGGGIEWDYANEPKYSYLIEEIDNA